jgi:DNA helicase-2/ATP-dependent DNA helicase PcrA
MSTLVPSYLDELNDVQRDAVTTIDGPVMVIAGPGSGKTRVLTYRIAHLIQSGVAPWNILALTFTNKAAREMKERIERVIGPDAYKVWAGTFHSLFAKILRREAHKIGYPNDFTIYDTDDTKSVVNEIIKQMKLDKKVYNPGAIRSRISSAKSNLITPKMYAVNEDLLNYDRMNRRPMTHIIYDKYVKKCMRAGAMDFDDLLLQMFKLLYQNPENVRQKYQAHFPYVMVDEFQDTNFLQYETIKLLVDYEGSQKNICIVGDDAQSIYSFRGATIENILQFESDFEDVKTYKLEQNYRSTHPIVEAANELISFNKKQIKKKIWTDQLEGPKIKIIKAMSDNEEGRRIADSIVEQKNRFHISNKEIAILYRTNAQSRVFEEHLRRFNLPYRIYGGLSFYSRKEIKDVMAYMRLAVNYRDNEAFKRIINYPRRGLGQTTIAKILDFAEENEISCWEALPKINLSGRASNLIAEFVQMIAKFRQKIVESDAYDAALHIAKRSGIIELLKADQSIEGLNRVENITALLDGIKEFVERDELDVGEIELDKSLASYLQSIALITDADQESENTDVITLMSTHSAKGLEFESVFVVGLEENLFPSFLSLSSAEQIDEERRLFYVALTRAKKYLVLSHANSRYQYGQLRVNDPSRFIEEIPQECLESTISLSSKSGLGEPKVLGNFKPLRKRMEHANTIDPKNFKPSPSEEIEAGMRVMHLKFGEGEVLKIDERRVATIKFENLNDNQEKRIMLQFAKLQILV